MEEHMAKRISIVLITVLLVLGLASCNNNPGGGGSSEPTRPATLELRYFKDNYKKGDTQDKLVGTLLYTSTQGTITTVDVKDEGVKVTGFDTSAEASGKIVKFTYKGLDCVGTYSVLDIPSILDAEGCFVVDNLTTYEFKSNSNTVVIEKYKNWHDYNYVEPIAAETKEAQYEVKVSSNGLTYAVVNNKRFYPDGMGGFRSYESDYLPEPEYGIGCYYISTEREKTVHTNPIAQGKYLVIQFTTDYTMKMWFLATKPTSIGTWADTPDYEIGVDDILFGTSGVFVQDLTVGTGENTSKNLCVYSRNDYKDSVLVVSKNADGYEGYFYSLTFSELGS